MRYQVDETMLGYIRDECKNLNPDILPAVIDAAHAEIERLETENARLVKSRDGAVSLQWLHKEQWTQDKIDTSKRHEAEKRRLVENIGFAATIFDRVMRAKRAGRKTVKVADLLDGQPEGEVSP